MQAIFSAYQDTRKAGRTLVTQMSQQLSQHRQLAAKTQLISDKIDFSVVEADIAQAAKSLKVTRLPFDDSSTECPRVCLMSGHSLR